MAHFIDMAVCRKHAEIRGNPQIVCGNSDYVLRIDTDAEWTHAAGMTVQILYHRNGETVCAHIPVINRRCTLPAITETCEVLVSLYADCIRTAAPAVIPCVPCITDAGGSQMQPVQDEFNRIMGLLAVPVSSASGLNV